MIYNGVSAKAQPSMGCSEVRDKPENMEVMLASLEQKLGNTNDWWDPEAHHPRWL